ncbi:MAG: MBL fold metallo-hydrolase [Clostridia bacterium]|nr:MBL fold metallo-hydrolase [Clostridia bacterium]
MKITFLGTSDGIPRPGHYCTSTMIEVGESIYLIDVGAPVIDLLLQLGKNPKQIKAIFNTHGHGDHLDGMLQLLDLCQWAYSSASFDICLTEQKIADGFKACIEGMASRAFPEDRMRFRVFEEGKVYEDENVKVTAIRTHHCDPKPSYAFVVESDGKKTLFTGDLSVVNGDFPKIAFEEEMNLIVCEMAHFGAEHIAPCLEKCKTKHVIFNHYQLRKERDIQQLMQCGKFPFPISMAHDGDVVQVY